MSRRLKVAIFAERFPPMGGGGISAAHYQIYKLLAADHDVKLFAFIDGATDEHTDVVAARGSELLGKLIEWFLVRYIRRYDRHGRIDNCRKIAHAIPRIRALNRHLHRFDPDIVLVSDDRLPALALKAPRRAKVIWMAHHNYERFRGQVLIDGPCDYDLFLAHRLERRAVRRCDHAIFVSRYMQDVFRKTLDSSLPGTLIPNYLDMNLANSEPAAIAELRERMGVQQGDITVFIPSGGTQEKGSRFVPEIVRRLSAMAPNVRFCITGPIEAKLNVELNHIPGPSIVWRPGPVSHEVNLRYASICDLCVSPTLIENYSCALLECQALGLPCVTFDVGGNREIIVHGETGFTTPYLDLSQLIDMAGLLVRDNMKRGLFSRAAVLNIQNLCDPVRTRRMYNDLFNELVSAVN